MTEHPHIIRYVDAFVDAQQLVIVLVRNTLHAVVYIAVLTQCLTIIW